MTRLTDRRAIERQRRGQTKPSVMALEPAPPAGVAGAAPRVKRPYDVTNRPRRTARASGARGDYDSARWKREAPAFLQANPDCACGCGRRATIVDHIEPVRASGDPRFFDQANWQGLARDPCHIQKSADDRAKAAGRKPRKIRKRVAIDPVTGLPLPGQDHPWSE
jgi:hypothetical protein